MIVIVISVSLEKNQGDSLLHFKVGEKVVPGFVVSLVTLGPQNVIFSPLSHNEIFELSDLSREI